MIDSAWRCFGAHMELICSSSIDDIIAGWSLRWCGETGKTPPHARISRKCTMYHGNIVGVEIRLRTNAFLVAKKSKYVPIFQKLKRGRQAVAMKALLRQSEAHVYARLLLSLIHFFSILLLCIIVVTSVIVINILSIPWLLVSVL